MTAGSDQRIRLQRLLSDLWVQVATPGPTSPLLTTALDLVSGREPLRLGRDRDGLPHLLIPLEDKAGGERILGGQGLSVAIRDLLVGDRPVRFLDLGCLRTDLTHVFAALSVDICMRLLVGTKTVRAVVGAIEEWRALVERGSSEWTPSRCAGLLGELIVLRRLLDLDAEALTTWSGPFGAAQDFRAPGRAIEVKTTLSPEGRAIRIHGSDQLEEPTGGVLHLVWFRLGDPAAASRGMTVRETIADLAGRVHDSALWARCLKTLRIPMTENPDFDLRRFAVVDERWYHVGSGFPRIVPASFATGAVPAGVGGLDYLVDLDTVPSSLLVEQQQEVLTGLAGVR